MKPAGATVAPAEMQYSPRKMPKHATSKGRFSPGVTLRACRLGRLDAEPGQAQAAPMRPVQSTGTEGDANRRHLGWQTLDVRSVLWARGEEDRRGNHGDRGWPSNGRGITADLLSYG